MRGDPLSGNKTIGLVLSGYDFLFYTSNDGKEECPYGIVQSSKDNWHAQFPTRAARKAHFDRCGGIDNRGPNCENVLVSPQAIQDPLPYREVQGEKSYGENLDGTDDGRQTSATCTHRKFKHPDGTKGIDNQYYRLLGCQKIVQKGAFAPSSTQQSVRVLLSDTRYQRTLLEIRDIDDEWNDEQVEVEIYRGKDTLALDAQDNPMPWQSQRIDEDTSPQRLRGRIVKGELTTEPADITSNEVSFFGERPILVRGARLRLRLTKTGAIGVRTGYVDSANWWRVRRTSDLTGSFTGDSPPALYEALHRLADGYKDPKTGSCTALSSAMKLEFVRALVIHPDQGSAQR